MTTDWEILGLLAVGFVLGFVCGLFVWATHSLSLFVGARRRPRGVIDISERRRRQR